jgi:hypothetical protein
MPLSEDIVLAAAHGSLQRSYGLDFFVGHRGCYRMVGMLIISTVFAARLIAAEDDDCRLTNSFCDDNHRTFAHILITLLS